MNKLKDIEKEIEKIEEQNKKEDEEIAWKKSYTRKLLLAAFGYIVLGFTLQINNYPNAWFAAAVPIIGILLISFILSFIKRLWEQYIYKG